MRNVRNFLVAGSVKELLMQVLLAIHSHTKANCILLTEREARTLRHSVLVSRFVETSLDGSKDDEIVDCVGRLVADMPDLMLVSADCDGARMADRLGSRLALNIAPSPNLAMLDCFEDKWHFHQFCRKHGLNVPSTLLFNSKNEMEFNALVRDIGLPFVVKPVNQQASAGIHIIGSEAEYRRKIIDDKGYDFSPLIVQRYIAGIDIGVNLFAVHGSVRSVSVQQRVWPQHPGARLCFVRNAYLEDVAEIICRESGYHGVMNIDARIENNSGKVFLFESNPRFWRSVVASAWCGMNFAAEVIDLESGTSERKTLESGSADTFYHPLFRPGLWRHAIFDAQASRKRLTRLMFCDLDSLVLHGGWACRKLINIGQSKAASVFRGGVPETPNFINVESKRCTRLQRDGNTAITIEDHRGTEGLEQIENEWDRILSQCSHQRFCHRIGWWRAYLRALETEPQSIHFFLFRSAGEAVAILPLKFRTRRLLGLPVRELRFPDNPHMPFHDIVCKDGVDVPELLTRWSRSLKDEHGLDWDMFRFDPVRRESAIAGPVVAHLEKRPAMPCAYFRCDQPYEELLKKYSKNFQANLKKARNRWAEVPGQHYFHVDDRDEMLACFDEFMRIEAAGWKGDTGSGTAIALDPALVNFYRSLIHQFSEERRVRVNVLKLQGKIIAAHFCLIDDDTLYVMKMAYDEGCSKYSPGNILLEHVLRDCIDSRRYRYLNLISEMKWHRDWRPEYEDVFRISCFNDTLMGRFVRTAIAGKQRLNPILKEIGNRQHKLINVFNTRQS